MNFNVVSYFFNKNNIPQRFDYFKNGLTISLKSIFEYNGLSDHMPIVFEIY